MLAPELPVIDNPVATELASTLRAVVPVVTATAAAPVPMTTLSIPERSELSVKVLATVDVNRSWSVPITPVSVIASSA